MPGGGAFSGAFIGEVTGTDARIAFGVSEPDVTAFVAGAGDTLVTHTRWFHGRLGEDGTFEDSQDGWVLTGRVEGEALVGALEDPDGEVTPWNVARTTRGTLDGPWAGPETGAGACQPGVVLYNSEFQIHGAFCPAEGEVVTVSAVDLDTADGFIDVQGDVPGAPVPFTAEPAFPLPDRETE